MKRDPKPIPQLITVFLLCALMLALIACSGTGVPTPSPAPETPPPGETAAPGDLPTAAPTDLPTDAPEPLPTMPTDEWLIGEAWAFAERIDAVRSFGLKREYRKINRLASSAYVAFYCDDARSTGVELEVGLNGQLNCFAVLEGPIRMLLEYELFEPNLDAEAEFYSRRITVTPEEILAAGCTETEGEEYLNAVGRCFAEKLAKEYETAPAGFYAVSDRAEPDRMVCDPDHRGLFYFNIALIPKDMIVFANRTPEYDVFLNCGTYVPEHFAWNEVGGSMILTHLDDGSWVGGTQFNYPSDWVLKLTGQH